MKKIFFLVVAFFALTTSANASIDPYVDVQFSILQPYYLSFTGTFFAPKESLGDSNSASIDVLAYYSRDSGVCLQQNIFCMTNFNNSDDWSTDINTGFDLEPFINAGCSDFTIIFDGVFNGGLATNVRELNVHVDENKNITYNWNFGC